MTRQPDIAMQSVPNHSTDLSVDHRIRYVIGRLHCRTSPLGGQMRRLGNWLENDVFPLAGEAGDEALLLIVHPDGKITLEQPGTKEPPALGNLGDLCSLLGRLGIQRLRVDTRLESNQIEDVLTLIYAYRSEVSPLRKRSLAKHLAKQLQSDEGLHFNCMHVRLRDDLLVVRYSYCVSRLSLAVRWFERRHRRFGDHRALFQSAPRYGLLFAALTLTVLLGFLITGSLAFIVIATAIEAAILFASVYVFMRGIGSIEYDNEESNYRLGRAYATLTRYSDRIRHDLAMARTVQRKLLPDLQHMPLTDKLEWVSSFTPETEVGGDYFDAAPLDENKSAIIFADVSGHGMAAALITVIVKMVFESWVEAGWTVSDFVRRVNQDLCRFTPEGSFVALVAGVYDAARNSLTFVNCGHAPEPFHLPSDASRPVTSLSQLGSMLLGVQEDIEIRETIQQLAPGGAVLLATDGLTEARNNRNELYGKDRLVKHLENHRSMPLNDLVASLVQDVYHFSDGAEQSDDQTVLALKVRCSPREPGTEDLGQTNEHSR